MASSFVHPSPLDGFLVLAVKFSPSSDVAHQLFFRQQTSHASQSASWPQSRSLFLCNVPPWAQEQHVEQIFQKCGPVEKIELRANLRQDKSQPDAATDADSQVARFRFGTVLFKRPSSLQHALNKMDRTEVRVLSTEDRPAETGLARWRKRYDQSIVLDSQLATLQSRLEERVSALDEVRAKEVRLAEARAAEEEQDNADVDDEGWTTVSRHTTGKRKAVVGGNVKTQERIRQREARKRKRKELVDFYKHQVKKGKLDRLSELKEKFEKDKQRQLAMKQERKFRPV